MSEYPETISVAKNTYGGLYVPSTALGGVNYVRADIAEAENARLQAQRDALLEALTLIYDRSSFGIGLSTTWVNSIAADGIAKAQEVNNG